MHCSVDGCVGHGPLKRGFCGKHYTRWRVHGDPLITTRRENGSGTIGRTGYITRCVGGVDNKKRIRSHVEIAERALGRKLPSGAIVHHANGIPTDNSNENLIICPSVSYHRILHIRMRAMEVCGNPNWIWCYLCQQYDDPSRMYVRGPEHYHRTCKAIYNAQRYEHFNNLRKQRKQRAQR